MSKKDYQSIARALYHERASWPATDMSAVISRDAIWRLVMYRIADVFAADNLRFDRARFIEACETGRCKGMPK